MREDVSVDGEQFEFEPGAPAQGEVIVPSEVTSRRGFLGATLGAGAGGAAVLAYPGETQATEQEELYIAADDPEFPEENNLSPILNGEESVGMMEFAEQMADMILSGAIELDAEQEAGLLAAGGMAGVAMLEKEEGAQVQRLSRGAMIKAILAGAVLFTASQFARAQEQLAFVSLNYNSNARDSGDPTGDQLMHMEKAYGKKISLEEFTRMKTCESPRGARLFAEHENVQRHNNEVKKRIDAGVRNSGTPQQSPISVFNGWYRRQSNRPTSSIKYSFFRLRNQVQVKGPDGKQNNVYKHYGVGQIPGSTTRQPHDLFWAGYLGTDQKTAQLGITRMTHRV